MTTEQAEWLCVVFGGVRDPELRRPRLGLNPARQIGDLVVEAATLRHELANLAVRVHHRGVVTTTERLPDLWK